MGFEGAEVAIAVIGAASSVYSATQNKAPNVPKAPVLPSLPNTKSLAATNDAAEVAAKSAGGTILSKPRDNAAIADGANSTRKSLLGQ